MKGQLLLFAVVTACLLLVSTCGAAEVFVKVIVPECGPVQCGRTTTTQKVDVKITPQQTVTTTKTPTAQKITPQQTVTTTKSPTQTNVTTKSPQQTTKVTAQQKGAVRAARRGRVKQAGGGGPLACIVRCFVGGRIPDDPGPPAPIPLPNR